MGWRMFDYRCEDCSLEFEALAQSHEDTEECTGCGGVCKTMPGGNLMWSNDKDTRTDMLKKRSADHTRREQKNGNMLGPKDLPKL